jgi:translation initiation factor IF-2
MPNETQKFKKVRLFRVSQELNVSVDTLMDHLKKEGFKNALSGTGLNASITDEDAYLELLEAFATDKAAASRVKDKRAAQRVDDYEDVDVAEAPPPEVETASSRDVETLPRPEPEIRLPSPDERKQAAVEMPVPEPEAAEAGTDGDSEPPIEEAIEADEASVLADEMAEEPVAAEVDEPEALLEDEAEIAVEDEADAIAEETAEAPAEEVDGKVISAGRYKLAGTKVIGKIDLGNVEEGGAKKKRKRKRKRKDNAEDAPAVEVAPEKTRETAVKAKKVKRKRGPEVNESDVQQTLQETLREMEQGTSRTRQRRRRERRMERAEERQRELEHEREQEHVLRVTEFLSTGELANLMGVSVTDVISTLFKAGMVVSINQRLDADTISIVADEYGFEVEFITEFGTDDIKIEEDEDEDLKPRAPVVTVMGHVDHGKTSLLDHIRSANVVAGEAGGITQHIGAYHVNLEGGRAITFLDTPGHEAFTAMRARGAKATDIVVLVVAADDSVMPQTIEAINHARAADVPIVVAINKIDRPDANTARVMQQLADQNVLVEQYGGKVQCALVSAKTGEGISDLLDKVLLEAELMELDANPDRNATGVIIESRLEKGRGNVATVLVQNGTLRVGDVFVAGIFSGRVRAMVDERENRINDVGPAHPALVVGFDGSPEVGDQFVVLDEERQAREIAQRRQQIHREQSLRQRKHITLDEIGRRLALGEFRELNLIIKADVGGSVEALSDALLKLSTPEVAVSIIHSGVGAITESDVMLASASDAVIIGFQVRPMAGARILAEREEIDVRTYSIIYNAIEEVRDALEGLLSPEESERVIGVAEIRETFKVPKVGTIAGCMVIDGRIHRNDRIRLVREGVVIYTGSISSLKRFKDDAREVASGYDCGLSIENFNDIKVGDQIESFEIVETKRKLEVSK